MLDVGNESLQSTERVCVLGYITDGGDRTKDSSIASQEWVEKVQGVYLPAHER